MPNRDIIVRASLLVTAVVALIALYLFLVDVTGLMPRCPIKMLTGFDCPGCGSQRALHSLLEGHLSESFHHNLILPFAVAYLAVCGFHWINPGWNRMTAIYTRLTSPVALWVIVAIVAAWTIVRNIVFQ